MNNKAFFNVINDGPALDNNEMDVKEKLLITLFLTLKSAF